MDFDAVLAAELAHIEKTRSGNPRKESIEKGNRVGLALSGGGIRSASFALGVLQALVVENALARFDYLSTVSGGGYIGSALTWLLSKIPGAGLVDTTFPLSGPPGGTRRLASVPPHLRALDFIRQRGNYLAPRRQLSLMAGIAFVLRGLSSTLLIYMSLVFAALLALQGALLAIWSPGAAIGKEREAVADAIGTGAQHIAGWAAVAFLVLSGLSWLARNRFFWPLLKDAQRANLVRHPSALAYYVRNLATQWFGTLLSLLLGLLGLAALLYFGPMINHDLVDALKPGIISAVGAAMAAWGARSKPMPAGRVPLLMVAGALLLIGLLWLAQLTSQLLLVWMLKDAPIPLDACYTAAAAAVGIAAIAVALGLSINANKTSLHRFYRDRLMETFLPDPDQLDTGVWAPAAKADAALLDRMCGADLPAAPYAGPYHLINANVVLTGSAKYRFSGRAGDSFLFSPLHVGSDATGWVRTTAYRPAPKMNRGGSWLWVGAKRRRPLRRALRLMRVLKRKDRDRGLTLASVMATSGAAANPNAGVGGTGLTRSRVVSLLMTLFNIRLGYWLVNPTCLGSRTARARPNLLRPAALNMFGSGLNEHTCFLQITDGGHFDNTGVYELVRRRCRLIVLSEAGADARFEFGDLASMIERIRVDFGVNVDFMDGFGLEHLVSANRAAAGYAIARLRYADTRAEGFLIVIKPTLTAGLPEDLYARRAQFPAFPHESTADQFFNEAQFEAYRELGYRLARSAVNDVQHDYKLADVRDIWEL